METLGKFTLFVLLVILSFLTGLFGTYIVLSIAQLFKLAFITQFSFVQLYGIWIIIGLIKFKYIKSNPDETFSESMAKLFAIVFVNAGTILLTWGMSFVAYSIIS